MKHNKINILYSVVVASVMTALLVVSCSIFAHKKKDSSKNPPAISFDYDRFEWEMAIWEKDILPLLEKHNRPVRYQFQPLKETDSLL